MRAQRPAAVPAACSSPAAPFLPHLMRPCLAAGEEDIMFGGLFTTLVTPFLGTEIDEGSFPNSRNGK